MEYWRCLPWSGADAALELASGSALLTGLTPLADGPPPSPALRWYSVAAPALVLGAGQPLHQVDTAACQAAGVTLHRRSSGGTSVLLEPSMLMQDIALPRSHRLARSDVTESYRWLGEVWAAVLHHVGTTPHVVAVDEARSDTQALDSLTRLSCYGGRSPYEVLVGGQKVVGFAQVRRRHGILLQVGIYTHWSPAALAGLLALSPAERSSLVERLSARVAGLSRDAHGHWTTVHQAHPPAAPPTDVHTSLFTPLIETFAETLKVMHATVLQPAEWSTDELSARDQAYPRYAPLKQDVL